MIDLKQTLDCIKVMKEYGTYRDQKVGRIREDANGMVSHYNTGQIILYTLESNKTATIESAMTQKAIQEQKDQKSLLTTVGTMIGVPIRYIEEIRM